MIGIESETTATLNRQRRHRHRQKSDTDSDTGRETTTLTMRRVTLLTLHLPRLLLWCYDISVESGTGDKSSGTSRMVRAVWYEPCGTVQSGSIDSVEQSRRLPRRCALFLLVLAMETNSVGCLDTVVGTSATVSVTNRMTVVP